MLGPYSVSKTALFGLTKVLAQELAADDIRVNCLAPGLIRTKFSKAVSNKKLCHHRSFSTVHVSQFVLALGK